TPLTSPASRSAGGEAPPGRPSRTSSAGTPTPKPPPGHHPPRPPRRPATATKDSTTPPTTRAPPAPPFTSPRTPAPPPPPTPPSTPATARSPRRKREYRETPIPLRVHQDALPPGPGTGHAAPPRRPRRGRRPDQLVHQRARPWRDHRGSRRGQDCGPARRPGLP